MDILKELSMNIDDVKKLKNGTREFTNFCKNVYRLCDGRRDLIEEFAKTTSIKADDIIEISSKNEKQNKTRLTKSKKHDEILSSLLAVKTFDDLVLTFTNYKITRDMLDGIINELINKYPKGYAKRINKLQKLFETYDNYQEELAEKKEKIASDINHQKLRKAALLVADEVLINENIYTIDEISLKLKIDKKLFVKYIKVFKEEKIGKKTVYEKILEKILENRKKYYSNKYIDDIKRLLLIIDKPIKVGKNYRLFDLLDIITFFDIDLPEIIEAIPIIADLDDFKNSNVKILKKMINYYQFELLKLFDHNRTNETLRTQKQLYKSILNSEISSPYIDDFDCQIITNIEKEDIIRLMKKNNIPISIFYFNFALKRYHKGKLELITKNNIDKYIKNTKEEKKNE